MTPVSSVSHNCQFPVLLHYLMSLLQVDCSDSSFVEKMMLSSFNYQKSDGALDLEAEIGSNVPHLLWDISLDTSILPTSYPWLPLIIAKVERRRVAAGENLGQSQCDKPCALTECCLGLKGKTPLSNFLNHILCSIYVALMPPRALSQSHSFIPSPRQEAHPCTSTSTFVRPSPALYDTIFELFSDFIHLSHNARSSLRTSSELIHFGNPESWP